MRLRANCIAKNGQGVLIFESATSCNRLLSNAAAQRGWTLITDGISYCLRRHAERVLMGASSSVRRSDVDFVIFVGSGRMRNGCAQLAPISRSDARERLRAEISPLSLLLEQEKIETIDRLLGARTYKLTYSDLDAAVDLLEQIVHRSPLAGDMG